MQINSTSIKAAMNKVFYGEDKDTRKDEDSDGSSSDECLIEKGKKKQRKHSHQKKNKRSDKHEELPKKAFKNLIKKELEKQCHQSFDNFFKTQEIDQNSTEKDLP